MQMTNDEFLANVGMEFKVARIRKKKSIPQLAKETGLSVGAIGDLENGQKDCRILTYKRLFDALEMDLKKLL